MIDHLTLLVSDYERSKAFFLAALAPLGYSMQMEFGDRCGIGENGMPTLWLRKADGAAQAPMHLAFVAKSRKAVDAFHAAALAAGAKDDGAPGLRAHYHPHYYGSFVVDPAGHHLEAVTHRPE